MTPFQTKRPASIRTMHRSEQLCGDVLLCVEDVSPYRTLVIVYSLPMDCRTTGSIRTRTFHHAFAHPGLSAGECVAYPLDEDCLLLVGHGCIRIMR
jgi:hypothetical protein